VLERIVVINDVATARGGATGLALLSIRLLRAAGIPVTMITGDDGANPEFAALGVEVAALGGEHIARAGVMTALAKGIYNPSSRSFLADWINKNDSPGTVYHVHGWSKILSPSIFAALSPVAKRTILHAHDFFLACPNGAFQDYQRDETCFRAPLGRGCLTTNCDKRSYAQKLWRVARQQALSLLLGKDFAETPVLMIHDRMRDFFVRSGFAASRLQVLRNPVEPFTTERVEAERNNVFYFVGRVEAEKGVEDAAAAASRAGVRLRIIGDGPERAAIETRYPHVEILGWSTRMEIGKIIGDARALVMPSRYPEPFGLVAAEASRSGLPVILPQNAFLAEEFARSGLGLVCDTSDERAFAETMRTMADRPAAEVRTMSERAFSAVVPIATTPSEWRGRLVALYEESVGMDDTGRRRRTTAAQAPKGAQGGERIRLFNVKFSPNLGDGILSEALENALCELGSDQRETFSVDLAARTQYGPGAVSRSMLLKVLNMTPSVVRQAAIRLPLEILLRSRWSPHYEKHMDGAEAVVIGGGNLFSDMDLNFPSKMAAVLHLAAERRLPTAVYGVGVAGGWSRAGLSIMRRALAAAHPCYVSVRDKASKEHFDAMFAEAAGRPAEIVRDPGLLVSRYVERPPVPTGHRPIGLCIMSAISVNYHSSLNTSGSELSDWYVALCERLGNEGRTILAFTNGSPEDELFLDAIMARLDPASGGRLVRRSVADPTELAGLIAGLDVLIAHRMHALIAGYAFAVPIFALQWDPKVDAFMESIGAEGFIAPAASHTLDRVTTAVHDLLEPKPQITDESRARILDAAFADVDRLACTLRDAIGARRSASSG
jgi:glycosyltransferase involved in cell wall biosynthesis/polysaccharide pyruvyl transferase WcaK-like protein